MSLPGSAPIRWRESPVVWTPLAWLAAAAWPPLILTLPGYPPQHWNLLQGPDWRFTALALGLLAVPAGMALLARERRREGAPDTRLGVIWRFALYGAVFSVIGQLAAAILVTISGWIEAGDLGRGLGAAETTFLIYGVGMMPFTMALGVAYAVWAGLMVALIAFRPTPPPMRVPPRYFADEPAAAGQPGDGDLRGA